jgi:hypothetical protein
MRRRNFIKGIDGSTGAWPLAARAQLAILPLIGFLSSRSPEESTVHVSGFHRGLKALHREDKMTRIVVSLIITLGLLGSVNAQPTPPGPGRPNWTEGQAQNPKMQACLNTCNDRYPSGKVGARFNNIRNCQLECRRSGGQPPR